MQQIIPQLLFFLLSAIVVLPTIPLRWGLFAFLLLAHIDLSGGDFASATSVGIENALKVVVVPTILLLRARLKGVGLLVGTPLARVWVLFVMYVAIAALWSPFKLSAVKQLGYFYSYTVGILVIVNHMAQDPVRTYRTVASAVLATLGLAVFQTFGLGNAYADDYRLTTFTNVQGFALSLSLTFALIFAIPTYLIGSRKKRWLLILLPICVLFAGSRTGFVILILILGFALLFYPISRRTLKTIAIASILIIAAMIGIGSVFTYAYLQPTKYQAFVQSSRSLQVLSVVSSDMSLDDLATFGWRLQMYQTILNNLPDKTEQELILGSGTSSTAELVTSGKIWYRDYTEKNIDGNRLAHNDFLRSLHEWGLVGTLIFLVLVAKTLSATIELAKYYRSFGVYLLLGALVALIVIMSTQNVLSASSSPLGMAIMLILSHLITLHLLRMQSG